MVSSQLKEDCKTFKRMSEQVEIARLTCSRAEATYNSAYEQLQNTEKDLAAKLLQFQNTCVIADSKCFMVVTGISQNRVRIMDIES